MLKSPNGQSENEIIVVIPVYKSQLSANENFSLTRVLKIFPATGICFITYKELEDEYKLSGKVYCFDKNFFLSIDGYNKLLLSPQFYKTFSAFKYILIYQLDAFLFSNDLTDLINKDYDYV